MNKNPVIYQTGAIELRIDSNSGTIWATRMQMGEVFGEEAYSSVEKRL